MAGKLIVQRNILALLTLVFLAACASNSPRFSNIREADQYQQVAANHKYAAPGPAWDPWGPYIAEASTRFDVPETWIREVMLVESGGNEYINGRLTTSPTGAMGLMQVEPETYDELRAQYSLGGDPYNPHDNILAGTAYLRQMYNQFGTPGFLAAYNAGPGRLAQYIAGRNTLPDATRQYIAMIAPSISGSAPINRSPNDQLAYNVELLGGAPVRRRTFLIASNDTYEPRHSYGGATRSAVTPVTYSALAPPVPPEPPSLVAVNTRHRTSRFSLIGSAYADTPPASSWRGGSASWAIQVGAYQSRQMAHEASETARQRDFVRLARAYVVVGDVVHGEHRLYRARLAGLTRIEAEGACERLSRGRASCIVVSPASTT